MSTTLHRLLFWVVPVLALAAGLAFALWPRPVEVDFATAQRGPMISSVAEEGETRIKDIFVLSAPIRGRVLRVESEEGDAVTANETVVAEIEPIDPAFLDLRSEAEARAAVDTAKAALSLAEAEVAQAEAELDFATAELDRKRRLKATDTVSDQALDAARRDFRIREAALSTAKAALEMRRSELAAAEIRLLRPAEAKMQGGDCPCIPIRSPVSGQVLRVLQESEGVVEAGQPLIEIGDPGDLEIVVDFLSTDAVRIEPGQRAIIEGWGGEKPLNGEVSRIEPYGFTKISALGIEEQRVNVVVELTDPPEHWRRLGHGFQVDVHVVLWEYEAALKAPLTALFREGDGWAVFVVADGRAELRPVAVGHRNDLEAEIAEGLAEGENLVRYPSDQIEDGTRVRPR